MIATFLQGNIAGRCGGSWSGCATAVCDSCAAVGSREKQEKRWLSRCFFGEAPCIRIKPIF